MGNYLNSLHRTTHEPLRQTKTGIAVTLLWLTLSLFLAVLALVSFLQPTWLYNDNLGSAGLQIVCVRTTTCPVILTWNFKDIASGYWQLAVVCQLLACTLFCLSPNLVVLVHCFEGVARNRGFLAGGILQICGAVLLAVACLVFPMGWSAPAVRALCGSAAGSFAPGQCSLGWAYILAILSSVDALVLSIIVMFLYERVPRSGDNSVNQPLFNGSDVSSSHCSSRSESGHVLTMA